MTQKIKAADLPKILKELEAGSKKSNPYEGVRQGYREDIGIYVMSSWEANFARYLNFLLEHDPEICDWQYEPHTFEFPIKHGITRYTPDFKVYYRGGKIVYYEIKGYMDRRSQTKLKRMKKYYPGVKLLVIEKEQYRAIAKWRNLIPGWEKANASKAD